jgi:hypothetical protein
MILGMSTATFTLVHVIISLVGIVTGFIVLAALLKGRLGGVWNTLFLVFTILTSVTGFFYPITKVTPGIILGVISLIVLAISLFALYVKKLEGGWKRMYAVTAMIAQFFNTFVLFNQSFQKIPFLAGLPKIALPVCLVLLLVFFIYFTYKASKAFRSVV